VWTNEGDCPSATPSSAFTSFVQANADNPKVYGYYLADEPQSTAASCVAAIKARADYIHSKNPNQKALVLLTDYPGTYAAYRPAVTNLDLVGIDPYPCRWDIGTSGGCDYEMIEEEVTAAQAAGIPASALVPMFQVFGDNLPTWKPPTVPELQSILATWQEYLPDPTIDMTYTWGIQPAWGHTDTLQTRTDWQDVMRAYIDGLAVEPSPTPTPTPTSQPRQPSRLTTNATPEPVRRGAMVTVRGRLTRLDGDTGAYVGYRGGSVTLQRRTLTGQYNNIRTIRSDSYGYLRTSLTALAQDRCYRFTFSGTATTAPSTAWGDCVHVR
jgi:hypothetical protein